MWLPETAVNDTVLGVLADEGIRFTILAPHQAGGEGLDVRKPYRWTDGSRAVGIVFYDGPISHDIAFGLNKVSAEELVARVKSTAPHGGLVAIATDGESFGHHHHFAERTLAYALPIAAPRDGITVGSLSAYLDANPPEADVPIRESSWSCSHGVARWREDCGCSTGGEPGADQRWRAPLRQALDLLRDHGVDVFERRGKKVLHDPWAARDAYIDVLLGVRDVDDFAREHVTGDTVEALTLLEQQRHALLMYTSCAWFFWDLAGLETVQCLRYAARANDLLVELDEEPPVAAFLDVLGKARSNQPGEGSGVDVWHRHVEPARVTASRVAAHVALAGLLEHERPSDEVAAWDIVDHDFRDEHRGALVLTAGVLTLRHRRTQRITRHTYAAMLIGTLDVIGCVRDADVGRDEDDINELFDAVDRGERLTTLLRLIGERFGPEEFGLDRALPDAAEQIVAGAANVLEDRFADAFERLYGFNRRELTSLVRAGLPLPAAIRLPAELALARRLEAEITAQHGSWDPRAYDAALAAAHEAAQYGLSIDAPRARAALEQTLEAAVQRAVDGETDAVTAALALRELADELGVGIDLSRPQEAVYDALQQGGREDLHGLAEALRLAWPPATDAS
jgi:hypothetical protein